MNIFSLVLPGTAGTGGPSSLQYTLVYKVEGVAFADLCVPH